MIRHIVAFDQKLGIAKNGGQPWNIPEDSQYFRDQTKSHGGQVLVGMTTFKTFEHPLSDRTNFVVTHQTEPIDGVIFVHDLPKFFAEVKGDIWVAGGASIFAQTLGVADELYITRIEADFGCDQFYTSFDETFSLALQSEEKQQNGFQYRFEVYVRNHEK